MSAWILRLAGTERFFAQCSGQCQEKYGGSPCHETPPHDNVRDASETEGDLQGPSRSRAAEDWGAAKGDPHQRQFLDHRHRREGVIQLFNIGAERMLGYAAADVVNKITPADISDPQNSSRAPLR